MTNEATQADLFANLTSSQENGFIPTKTDGQAAIFSRKEIIDAAYFYYVNRGFPYPSLPIHICMQEINKLAAMKGDALLSTHLGYQVADTYHPHRFHVTTDKGRAPFDAYSDPKLLRGALELQSINHNIGTNFFSQLALVHGTQGASNFRPGVALFLYRRYLAIPSAEATILDTSTGFGGRLVAFIAFGGKRYIGIDPSTATYLGNLQLAHAMGMVQRIELYHQAAEDIDPALLADRCDFAFTSPPYFSKEHYADEATQSHIRYRTFTAWCGGFLQPMFHLQWTALKNGAITAVNVSDVTIQGHTFPLVEATLQAAKSAGFTFIERLSLTLPQRFGAGHDEANQAENEPILIFRK